MGHGESGGSVSDDRPRWGEGQWVGFSVCCAPVAW